MTKYPNSECEEHRDVKTDKPVCIICMAQEIENLQAMYDAQCQCADEGAEKYRAEVERKADASLLARIAELEQALGAVNARLADAQAVPNAIAQGREHSERPTGAEG